MKYFIKRGEFINQYSLVYADSNNSEQQAIAEGYERITRKDAEHLAAAERRRRKEDPQFAYYATAHIYPYGVAADFENYPWTKRGYLVVQM